MKILRNYILFEFLKAFILSLAVFTFEALSEGAADLLLETKSAQNSSGAVLLPVSGTEVLPAFGAPLTVQIGSR